MSLRLRAGKFLKDILPSDVRRNRFLSLMQNLTDTHSGVSKSEAHI